MGQLVDGVWHDVWYDTKSTGGRLNAPTQSSAIGSRLTDQQGHQEQMVFQRNHGVTIFMCLMLALGHIGP